MVKMEKTKQVLHALRTKYDDNGYSYAFLEQVGNATGWSCNRHADALAVSLWESRGLEITGFEVKVSRTDWLKELKHPDKADPIAKYCNSWYLVLGDADIIQFGELPMTWGLMVPHTKNSLKIVKQAKRNLEPKPVDLPFLCAILRRAVEQCTTKAKLRAEFNRGYEDGERDGKQDINDRWEWDKKRVDGLEKKIAEFEKTSGFSITERWKEPKQVGEAVKMVLNGTYLKELESLEHLHKHALNCARSIEEEIQKHKETEKKTI